MTLPDYQSWLHGLFQAGTFMSICSDALGFLLTDEHWPEFWAWIIATPPDTGMSEDETRRLVGEARSVLLKALGELEQGLPGEN